MEIPMRTEVSHQVRINDLASPPEVPDVRGMLGMGTVPVSITSNIWKLQESWLYINRWFYGWLATGLVVFFP